MVAYQPANVSSLIRGALGFAPEFQRMTWRSFLKVTEPDDLQDYTSTTRNFFFLPGTSLSGVPKDNRILRENMTADEVFNILHALEASFPYSKHQESKNLRPNQRRKSEPRMGPLLSRRVRSMPDAFDPWHE
jgi:hypothetical protein